MKDELAIIPIAQLRPSPRNPRTHFDDARQQELEASMKAKGLLQPLLVRPLDHEEAFEIIAGHRRFAAALTLGLVEVPARILDLPDGVAFETAITENLQRADLRPLEEARAFAEIVGHPPHLDSVRALAERLGKSSAYIWDRVKLLDLVLVAQQLLERGKFSVEIAQLLARETPELQAKAIDPLEQAVFEPESGRLFAHPSIAAAAGELLDEDDLEDADADLDPWANLKARTLREVRSWLATHVRFNPMEAATIAPLEFKEVADQVLQAHLEPGRGKKVVHVTHDHHVHPEAKGEERTYCAGSWRHAEEACDRTVLGVIVTGPGYGQAFPVCVHKDCSTHWADEIRRKERDRKAAQANPGKAAQDEVAARKRDEERRAKEAADQAAYKKAIPALKAATIAALKKAKPLSLEPLLYDRANNRAVLQAFGPVKTTDDLVRFCALRAIWYQLTNEWSGARNFAPIAKHLGIDLAGLLKGEEKAPAPKKAKAGKKR